MTNDMSRREFISASGKAAAGVGLGLALNETSTVFTQAQKVSANEKVVLGLIGCGGQGRGVMGGFFGHPDVAGVATVCDVDAKHADAAVQMVEKKYGKKPEVFKDFRKLLERKDVDVVIISTPDHWHALPTVYSCEAGKDIYLEKPISHNIVEGRAMVNAAKKFKRVVQVGTWQRSVQHFVDAIDYVRSGKLGKVSVCRAWTLGGAGVGKQPPTNPPPELDWDFWLGPAPKVPYRPNRCHFGWRWFFDYGSGLTGDWGVHMLDIVPLAMGEDAPLEVHSVGGKIVAAPDDDRDTPDTQMAIFKFKNFVMNWEIHVGGPGLDGGSHHGTEFIGEKGYLIVDRGGWKAFDKNGKELPKVPSERKVGDHTRDFLDCVKSRPKPRSDIESMHQTTKLCHLANLALRTGENIRWDDAKEEPIGNRRAKDCPSYEREYRRPWKLPMHKLEQLVSR
jgi:predicted dehydrogenase